jgi:hypothetical protein
MLGSFKQVFKEKPKTYAKIPKGILESLSVDMPEGFSYTDIGDGFCILNIPQGSKLQGKLNVPGATPENLSKCKTFGDLMNYATNIQKPICIESDEEGLFTVNGVKISANQFVQCPLKDLKLMEGSLRWFPQPLTQEFELKMSLNDIEESVRLVRVIHDSVEWIKFAGNNGAGLLISILARVDSPEIKINVTTDFKMAKSVENVLKSMRWYNGFALEEVKIFGSEIKSNKGEGIIPYPEEALYYWKQLYELEEIFDVKFNSSLPVYGKDVMKTNQLYRSIIEKRPFRTEESITKLNGNGDYDTTEEIDDLKGKELYFRFLQREKTEIMGVALEYVAVKYVFGTKVKKISFDKETKDYEVILEQAREELTPYTATQYFVNEEQLEAFLTVGDDKREEFADAEIIPPIDYE